MIIKIIRGFFALFIVQLLVACGGGDDPCEFQGTCTSADGADPTIPAISLDLKSLTTSMPIVAITPSEGGVLVATVTGTTQPVVVTFTLKSGATYTAITRSGKATQSILNTGGINSVDEVEASFVTADDQVITSEALAFEFVSQSISLKLFSSITGLETSNSSIADPGRLVATVVGITRSVVVNFSTTLGSVSNSGAAATDGLNEATVDLIPSAVAGDAKATASVTIDGVVYSKDLVFQMLGSASAPAGKHVEFVSATPETIALKDSGGDETSEVKFKVIDADGNPVTNQTIDFQLNTTSGGITMTPSSTTSDNEGVVKTIVSSGTISTSVRVTAILKDEVGDIISEVQSSRLVISTGIPDQDSFSVAPTTINVEGGDIDGTTTTIVARLADGFNNPVLDGTTVFFSTEGGVIESSCQTLGGTCSVVWTSQSPRPAGDSFDEPESNAFNKIDLTSALHTEKGLGQPYAGRVTVTATAIGEESFPDLNGNGRFDASEMTAFLGNDISGNPYDLPEAFSDFNEDGIYNPTESGEIGGELEELIDFNVNGLFDVGDGLYNGSLCSVPAHAGCSSKKTVNVRGDTLVIMSGSTAYITLVEETPTEARLCISDKNNQPMPAETAVVIEWSGSLGKLDPDSGDISKEIQSWTWANSNYNGPRCFYRGIVSAGPGSVKIGVTTPLGLVSGN